MKKSFTLFLFILLFFNFCKAQSPVFYATTTSGGSSDSGTIVLYNPSANKESIVYSFKGNPIDGASPGANLVYDSINKLFYGMTWGGGNYNKGTIFSFNPVTNEEKLLYSFGKGDDGSYPEGSLVFNATNWTFYGMTERGGSNASGTIFSFNSISNTETVLWNFGSGTDGSTPFGNLIYNSSTGLYYGMTYFGGIDSANLIGGGTIFSFNLLHNTEKILWNFGGGKDGYNPDANLVYDPVNDLYYATTSQGGTSLYVGGTIISFNPNNNEEKVVWNFGVKPLNEEQPQGDLTFDSNNGLFYGMTGGAGIIDTSGGSEGTIFSFNPVNNTENALWDFGIGTDGAEPWGNLIYNSNDGLFYGMAATGGTDSLGTIFSFNPNTNKETTLWNFQGGADGEYPTASFVLYTPNGVSIDSITTGIISPLTYCSSTVVNVPYTILGTFTGSNIFTAQLSDSSGNFTNPVNIGTVASTTAGTINATIPANTLTGSGYRIRIVSSNPVETGSDNESNITINTTPTSTFVADHYTTCVGENVTLTYTGNASANSTYLWNIPPGKTSTAKGPITVTFTSIGAYGPSLVVTDNGCVSASSSVIINVLDVPPAVTAAAGTNAATSQFTGNWNASIFATTYFLDVSLHSNFTSFVTGYNNLNVGNTTVHTVTGLTPGTTYYYRIRASDSCGISANSDIITVSTTTCAALAAGTVTPASSIICPGTTQLLTLSGASGSTLQWQKSTNNINWSNVATGGNTSTYTTSATDGASKKYYRCVSSNACYNASSTSVIVDVSSPTITVSSSDVTDKSVTLNWSPAGSGNYGIDYSGATTGTLTGITPPYTLSGLTSGGSYSVTVTQTSPSGCQSKGTITGIITLCTAPTALHVTATTTNSISVAWAGPVGNYRVYYTQLFSSSVATLIQDVTNAASATISSLIAGATYKIYVAQKDCPLTGNIGQPCAFIYGVTTNTTTCATPVIDLVSSACSGQIQVTVHGSASGQYRIYVQQLTPVLQPANSYTITGGNFSINVVGAGQTYLVAAASVCSSSASNLTEWASGIVVPAACNELSNLLLSQPTCEGFTASWNADNCTSNTLSSYALYVRKQGAISWTAMAVPSTSLFKTVNTLAPGNTYQSFIRSAYTCNGYIVYGPASATQTITTQSGGCRVEDETTSTGETLPIVSTNNNESFSLYPNPNSGEFTIDISQLNTEEENVRVEVLNVVGQTVLTHLTTISNGHLNEFIYLPNGTASGMYFVRVTAGKNVYTSKVNISR